MSNTPPERRSGLRVPRYDADPLAHDLGPDWRLNHDERSIPTTPLGVEQRYPRRTCERIAPDPSA